MGQRDAFGNEVGENPIDAMGWHVPPSAARPAVRPPTPDGREGAQAAFAAAAPIVEKAVAGARRRRRNQPRTLPGIPGALRPRRVPFVLKLAVVVAIVWALAGGALVAALSDLGERVERAVPTLPLPEVTPMPGEDRATGETTPLTRAGFTGALALAREELGADVDRAQFVRVDATTVVISAGGRLVTVSGGEARTSQGGAAAGLPSFALGEVDAAAPARIAQRADGLQHALLVASPRLRWVVTTDGGTRFARPDGRALRRTP